jgi:phage-related protein
MTSLQETIGHLLMPILQKLVDFISPIIDTITKWADENPQLAQTVLMILGAVALLGPVLVILGTIITSVGTVTAALGGIFEGIALGPIALIIGAVVALYAAFQSNFLGIRDLIQPILNQIGKGFGYVKEQVDVFVARFKDGGLREAVNGFFAVFEDGSSSISGILQHFGMNPQTADSIAQWFSTAFDKVKPVVDAALGFVEDFVKNFSSNIQLVPFYVTYYFGIIRDTISKVFTDIGKFVQDKFLTPIMQIGFLIGFWLQPVVDWFQTNIPLAIAAAQEVLNRIQRFLQDLWTAVKPFVDPILTWFQNAATTITNFFTPVFATIQDVINKALQAMAIIGQLTGADNAGNGGIVGLLTGATGGGGDSGVTLLQQLIADITGASGVSNPVAASAGDIGAIIGSIINVIETSGAGPGGLPPVTGTAAGNQDFGGAGFPGQSYLIGTGAQPEMFTPSSAGTFTPNGGGKRFTWNGDINVPPNSSINVTRAEVYDWIDQWAEEAGIYG